MSIHLKCYSSHMVLEIYCWKFISDRIVELIYVLVGLCYTSFDVLDWNYIEVVVHVTG